MWVLAGLAFTYLSEQRSEMARRVPGLPQSWQQLLLAVAFVLFWPMAPLVIDLIFFSEVHDVTLFLTAGLSIIGIGIASKSLLQLGFTIIISVGYMMAYGAIALHPNDVHSAQTTMSWVLRWLPLSLCLIWHLFERYNRHVVDLERFWEFSVGTKSG